MASWHIRDFQPADLEAAVRVDAASSKTRQDPAFALADVVAAVRVHPSVVAVAGGEVIGSAVSMVTADRAWVLRLSLAQAWRGRGLGSELLSELEHRLLGQGVARISALLPAEETDSRAFSNSGFTQRAGMTYWEKTDVVSPHAAGLLAELGGSVPPAGLWQRIAGMAAEKTLIERRIVLALSRPELAAEHGVHPPQAVVLFGPSRTGKTTFARAAASRLGWPFVELFPSRLGESPAGLAGALDGAFAALTHLEHVVFIDEVEEIAAVRRPATGSAAVVNELLKALLSFRDRPGRLLVCATNSVSALDPAFLRHGQVRLRHPGRTAGRHRAAGPVGPLHRRRHRSGRPRDRHRRVAPPPTSRTSRGPSPSTPSNGPSTPAPAVAPGPGTSSRPSPTSGRP